LLPAEDQIDILSGMTQRVLAD